MVWILLIVLLPFLGSVIYLVYSRYVFLFGTKIR
ncbi:PLDc N-terminal domain-containing protein [Chryseobacterium angstadtii]